MAVKEAICLYRKWALTLKGLDFIYYMFKKGLTNPGYQASSLEEIICGARFVSECELRIVVEDLYQRGLFKTKEQTFTFNLGTVEITALGYLVDVYLEAHAEKEKGGLIRDGEDLACYMAEKIKSDKAVAGIILDSLAQKGLLDNLFDQYTGKDKPFAITQKCCPRSFWELCIDIETRQAIGLDECRQLIWLFKATRDLGFDCIAQYKRFFMEHRPS